MQELLGAALEHLNAPVETMTAGTLDEWPWFGQNVS